VGPALPDDAASGAGEDAYGVGVVVSLGAGALTEVGGQGVRWRLSPGKSQTASRSCLSTAQRNATILILPDWRVRYLAIGSVPLDGAGSAVDAATDPAAGCLGSGVLWLYCA
jgi:hypothetical protein